MDENNGYLIPSRHGGDFRRQDEPVKIYPNGSIWLSTKDNYLKDKTFYSKRTKVFKMEKLDSYDIDDELDFFICESIYKKVMNK